MELDQIKSIWQEESSLQAPRGAKERDELAKALFQKGRSQWDRIRRNIWLELFLLAGILTLTGVWLSSFWSFLHPWEQALLPAMALLGAGFYSWKLHSLAPLAQDQPLKIQLQDRLRRLGRYLRFYRIAVVALVPLLGATGVLYGLYRAAQYHGQSGEAVLETHAVWVLTVAIAYAAAAAWFSQRFVHHLYGRYYQRLKQLFVELTEDLS